MPTGTIFVDFAGTRQEAIDYARENGLHVPFRGKILACTGLPMVSLPFKNYQVAEEASKKLTELGWDRDSQEWPYHKIPGYRPRK